MSEIFSGVIGGFLSSALRRLEGPVRPDCDGKRRLQPGLAVWLSLAMVFGITGVFIYMLFFLEGERADWETQKAYLFLLVAGGVLAFSTLAWFSFARLIRWDESGIEVQWRYGKTRMRHPLPIAQMSENRLFGYCRVDFVDGSRFRFSYLLRGAGEFMQYLARDISPILAEEPGQ
jgi:hypothetical protein